jgi:hypothetical protein
MTTWIWPGLLSLDVPPGWNVSQSDALLEVVPSEPVGTAQISILRRGAAEETSADEAIALAERFTARLTTKAVGKPAVGSPGDRWVASLQLTTQDREGLLYWNIESHLWSDLALVCTYCAGSPTEPSRQSALGMFRSIRREPPEPD